jgi:hypothetical protein
MQFCKPSQAVENKIGFVTSSPSLFLHTGTLCQPVKTGKKAGEMTQLTETFFYTHHGVFMTTTHFSVVIFTARFKSHLNSIKRYTVFISYLRWKLQIKTRF